MNKVPLLTGGKHDTRHRPQTSTGAVNSLYNVPYTTYGWDDVLALAANPYGFADKDHVWALMPCDYAQIDLREAKPDGSWKFHYLSADLDTGDYPKEKVVAAVRAALGPGVQFLVYSTFSAWTGKTYETFDENTGEILTHVESKGARWAVIAWLAQPVPSVAFAPLGKAFLDLLVAQGVEVEDRSSAQPKRLRYLPARHLDGTGAYDCHVEPGQLLALTGSHPLVTLSKAYIDQEAVDELGRVARAQKYAEQGKDEGPLSRHAAYRRKHPTTVALMEWLGFESIDGGVNWHHHAQGTKSYATELFPDGGLYTRSATVGAFGGAYDKNGGWYFQDTYDIYCAVVYHGNKDEMWAYADACLREYPDPGFEALSAMGKALYEAYEAAQLVQRLEVITESIAIAETVTVDATVETATGDWHHPMPPGMLGSVASLIFNSSARPVTQFAIAQALWFGAALVGSKYNIENLGLNLFLTIAGDSGVGKGESKRKRDEIISALVTESKDFDAQFKYFGHAAPPSAEGGRKMFHGDFVSLGCYTEDADSHIDSLMNGQPGSTGDRLRSFESGMWDNSGKYGVQGSVTYSKDVNNVEAVRAPALTVARDYQIPALKSYLGSRTVMRGHGPRQIYVTYQGPKTKASQDRKPLVMPPNLTKALNQIWTNVQLQHAGVVVDVLWEPAAQQAFLNMDDKNIDRMNVGGDAYEVLNRSHMNVAKVAALLAVFTNPMHPVLTMADWEWAESFVMKGYDVALKMMTTGDVGSGESVRVSRAVQAVVDYVKMPEGRRFGTYRVAKALCAYGNVIPFSYLMRKLKISPDFKGTDTGKSSEDIIRLVANELCQQDYLIKTTASDLLTKHGILLPPNVTQQLYVLGPAMAEI